MENMGQKFKERGGKCMESKSVALLQFFRRQKIMGMKEMKIMIIEIWKNSAVVH